MTPATGSTYISKAKQDIKKLQRLNGCFHHEQFSKHGSVIDRPFLMPTNTKWLPSNRKYPYLAHQARYFKNSNG
jgi:hypothetical protein